MSMIDNAPGAVKETYLKMKNEQGKKLELKVIGGNYYLYVAKGIWDRKIFNLLDSNGTDAIIPLRKNFRTTARGSPLRHRIARRIRNLEFLEAHRLKQDNSHISRQFL